MYCGRESPTTIRSCTLLAVPKAKSTQQHMTCAGRLCNYMHMYTCTIIFSSSKSILMTEKSASHRQTTNQPRSCFLVVIILHIQYIVSIYIPNGSISQNDWLVDHQYWRWKWCDSEPQRMLVLSAVAWVSVQRLIELRSYKVYYIHTITIIIACTCMCMYIYSLRLKRHFSCPVMETVSDGDSYCTIETFCTAVGNQGGRWGWFCTRDSRSPTWMEFEHLAVH